MTMEIYYSKWEMFGLILIFGNVISEFGICAMECDFELLGPSFNFKNIAYGKLSRHDSNIDQPYYSDLANDNDLSSCSYTSERNKGAAPWWNLWIPEKTTFKKMEFVTIKDHRWDFQYFEVNVYNVTQYDFENKKPLTGGISCYKHNVSIPKETKIEVTCDGFPYGNLIRIQLHSKKFQLVLCDFRLYGECQNDFYGNDCEKCSENCLRSGNRYCNANDGTCLRGCNPGWTGNHCENECQNGTWGKNCEQTCGNCYSSTCDRFTGTCPTGCSAGYTRPKCTDECRNGYYGKDCRSQCNNRCSLLGQTVICDKVNGTCLNGCTAGYKGSFCNEECEYGKWGIGCQQDCGKCFSSFCTNVNGYCTEGCAPGYKHTRKCIEECEDDKWGVGCQQDCGNCLSSPCDNVNGYCYEGCAPGYKYTSYCIEECDDGSYGRHCYDNCSHNCQDICDKKTGKCSKCKSGWKGNNCSEACSSGEWGENCLNACGKCKNEETCRKNDGICVNGCIPGYQHTDLCDEECENGTYGEACGRNCSGTCNGVCNKVNGTCDQCQAGWTGDFCENGTITIDFGFGKQGSKILKMNHVSFGLAILSFMFVLYYCITLLLKHN